VKLPTKSQRQKNGIWPSLFCLGMILVGCAIWPMLPLLIGMSLALLPESPRAYRNNQHELLPDGRSVDLVFKGHDAIDGSFLVQTSRHKGLLNMPLKSRPLALAAEPDLRILPNGRAVIFIKNKTAKEPLKIGLDEFLEGVAEVPEYNTETQSK